MKRKVVYMWISLLLVLGQVIGAMAAEQSIELDVSAELAEGFDGGPIRNELDAQEELCREEERYSGLSMPK